MKCKQLEICSDVSDGDILELNEMTYPWFSFSMNDGDANDNDFTFQ